MVDFICMSKVYIRISTFMYMYSINMYVRTYMYAVCSYHTMDCALGDMYVYTYVYIHMCVCLCTHSFVVPQCRPHSRVQAAELVPHSGKGGGQEGSSASADHGGAGYLPTESSVQP